MTSSDFRQKARDALKGNWFVAVIAGFIASLLGGVSSGGGTVEFDFSSEDAGNPDFEAMLAELGITPEIFATILAVIGVLVVIGLVYAVVAFIIGSGISVGYSQLNLDIVDGRTASVGTVFSRFDQWKTAIVARLLSGLYIFLWSLLFVIPGIIAAYSYEMVSFVLAEHPYMTPSEALAESKRIMSGNRWRLFCLEMSFIGWSLLCVLTLGIGTLWLLPYMQASRAAFYREISKSAI